MSGSGARRQSWLWAALVALAMLVLPLAAWFVLPSPPQPARATSTAAPRESAVPAATGDAEETGSRPAPSRPRERPDSQTPRDEEAEAGMVRGRVRDADGNPVAGAVVRCVEDGSVRAPTDADGRFELPPEADGCLALAVSGSASSRPAKVRAGADNSIELLKGGGIAGIVVDDAGTPVESFTLSIESYLPPGGDGPGPGARTRKVDDERGNFAWNELPAGRYVLSASAEGRPPARSDSVQVDAGATTHHVRITLGRGATLKGLVTDASSRKPVVGAGVALDSLAASSHGAASTTTDASGEFVLEGVPRTGPFSVRVTHGEYRTKIVSGLSARGGSSMTERIALTARGDGGADSELAGIGAMLNNSSRGVSVAGVIDGGPASRAGLRAGDLILRIDGDDAGTLTLSDCVQRLRGPEGSRVNMQVSRDGGTKVDIAIVRDLVVR